MQKQEVCASGAAWVVQNVSLKVALESAEEGGPRKATLKYIKGP